MKKDQTASTGSKAATGASKIEAVITLLSREEGATLDELTGATGWQAHTARAMMTGLKKKGHTIKRTRADGTSRWRITASAAA